MQNFGGTKKEHYGMLWYFWSGQFIPAFSCFEQLIFLCFTQFGGKFSDTALLNSDSNSLSSFSGLP